MKKKIILSMVVALFTLGTVGCGSDDDNTPKDKNITKTPTPSKEINKPKPKEIKTVLNTTRDEQTEESTVYFQHQGQGAMTIVYVDTDNDTSTGYQADEITKGSEFYMVGFRDGSKKTYLFKVDDENMSKWKEDVNNTDFTYVPDAKADTIVFKNELIKDKYFTVLAQVADKEWTAIDKYTQTKVNDVQTFANKLDDIKGDSNLSMEVALDENNKYLSIKLKGKGYLKNTQIFFDLDETNATGYNVELWKNFGADYMIGTDGKLTKWLKDENTWDYANSVTIPVLEKNNTINFSFRKSFLKNAQETMRVGLAVSDNAWNVVHAIPEKNATLEAHQYAF